MALPLIAVERTIAADAHVIFDLLADPTKHPVIDGSGSVREVTSSDPRLSLGSTFGASMRLVVPYRVTNKVVEFEEDRRIAWRHWAGHRWRYLLTPTADGTIVREEWDATRLPGWGQLALRVTRMPGRNQRGMQKTLERLEALALGRRVGLAD